VAREHVIAGENIGYCLLLNRRCTGVALLFDRTKQFGREAKFIEKHWINAPNPPDTITARCRKSFDPGEDSG
jgi:hypothetical protein